MRHLVVACALALAACSGGTPAPAPDAPAAGAFGARCTTVSDSSTECTSGVCTDTIDKIGYPVCSVKCTYGMDSTCPVGSMGQKCNMKGYCRP